MSEYIIDFVEFFGLGPFIDGTSLTVTQFLGCTIIAFIGCILTIIGIRCIFEIIKIVTDWSKFR